MCSPVPAGASVAFPVGVLAGSLVPVSVGVQAAALVTVPTDSLAGASVAFHISISACVAIADPQEKIVRYPQVPVQHQQLWGSIRDNLKIT